MTAETLLSQNDELRKQLSLGRESVKTLTDSLVISNAEAELFRRKYADLKLRMDALGVESIDKDRAKLEQRLLKAVGDLQLSQKEQDEYRDQLLRLTESILRFLKSSQGGDPQARMDVEAQLRATNQLAGSGRSKQVEATQPTLMDGRVISVKEEWSLVVGKLGMPLRVVRGDRTIARLRVVDVREKISGALIQEMVSEKEKIKVGDRLQADAHQAVSLK